MANTWPSAASAEITDLLASSLSAKKHCVTWIPPPKSMGTRSGRRTVATSPSCALHLMVQASTSNRTAQDSPGPSAWRTPIPGEAHEVWRAPEGRGSVFKEIVSARQLFWSAGGHIAFPWEGDGWLHLYSVPAAGGSAAPLTPGDFEVE